VQGQLQYFLYAILQPADYLYEVAIITKMYPCATGVIVGLRGGHFTVLHDRVMEEEWMKN